MLMRGTGHIMKRYRLVPDRPFGLAALLLIAIVVAATSGCLTQSKIAPTRASVGLSPKLNPFVHFEDGAVLFIGVDGRAARYVKEGSIFPLGIGLANQSREPLTFTRESFVLEAADGTRYPLVSLQEYNRDYTRSRSDLRLADSFSEALASRFSNYGSLRRALYPAKGVFSTAADSFELGRLIWTRFYVYFPIPESGIHGQQFKLLVDAKDGAETFVVSFSLD